MHTAELGVVLLLFVIGLEAEALAPVAPAPLWCSGWGAAGRGGAGAGGGGRYLGLSVSAAAVVGIILALSSTAFVLLTLAERRGCRPPRARGLRDPAVPGSVGDPAAGPDPPVWHRQAHRADLPRGGPRLLVVVAVVGRPLLNALFRHVARVNSREMFARRGAGHRAGPGADDAGRRAVDVPGRLRGRGAAGRFGVPPRAGSSIAPFQGLLLGCSSWRWGCPPTSACW